MIRKLLLSFIIALMLVVPGHAAVTYVSMDALTDGSATVTDTWYLVGYSSLTPYRWTIASLFGLKFGTLTDGKYCTYSSSTGKISCTSDAGTSSVGVFEPPAAASTTNTTLACLAGACNWVTTTANCIYIYDDTTASMICATPAQLYAKLRDTIFPTEPEDEQIACFDNTAGVYTLKSCGSKTTYTEPTGDVKALCDTGTAATGACDPTAHPGGFSTIEVGHASDTTLSRASEGVLAVEGLSLPRIVASGSTEVNFAEIASTACEVIQIAATGATDTDVIIWNPKTAIMGAAGDTPAGTTGFVPATTGGLSLIVYPSTNYVNVKACNWSTGALNAEAFYINWKVIR